jgi:hypothetical protein
MTRAVRRPRERISNSLSTPSSIRTTAAAAAELAQAFCTAMPKSAGGERGAIIQLIADERDRMSSRARLEHLNVLKRNA